MRGDVAVFKRGDVWNLEYCGDNYICLFINGENFLLYSESLNTESWSIGAKVYADEDFTLLYRERCESTGSARKPDWMDDLNRMIS